MIGTSGLWSVIKDVPTASSASMWGYQSVHWFELAIVVQTQPLTAMEKLEIASDRWASSSQHPSRGRLKNVPHS